jgi:hypothetical protein
MHLNNVNPSLQHLQRLQRMLHAEIPQMQQHFLAGELLQEYH